MTDESVPSWYIDKQGKKKGPYSITEIRALLTQNEIKPETLVYPDSNSPSTITVQELLKSLADPAYNLFNALERARKVQTSTKPEPTPPKKRNLIFFGLIGIALLTFAAGVYRWLSSPKKALPPSTILAPVLNQDMTAPPPAPDAQVLPPDPGNPPPPPPLNSAPAGPNPVLQNQPVEPAPITPDPLPAPIDPPAGQSDVGASPDTHDENDRNLSSVIQDMPAAEVAPEGPTFNNPGPDPEGAPADAAGPSNPTE